MADVSGELLFEGGRVLFRKGGRLLFEGGGSTP